MRLLLHTCCAPCLIYPLERLKELGFTPTAYYYNPNIHPLAEYKLRLAALEDVAVGSAVELICPDYLPQDFFRAVSGNEQPQDRCHICWGLRLRHTAFYAAKNGFAYFTTTLLVSPYQDQAQLKRIGELAAEEAGVKFYYEDFRPGFRAAHTQARARGIYCQKYCGCIYSLPAARPAERRAGREDRKVL